jgi:hypothetical protein
MIVPAFMFLAFGWFVIGNSVEGLLCILIVSVFLVGDSLIDEVKARKKKEE